MGKLSSTKSLAIETTKRWLNARALPFSNISIFRNKNYDNRGKEFHNVMKQKKKRKKLFKSLFVFYLISNI